DRYRIEQLAAIDAEENQAFFDAENRDTASAAQDYEKRKAAILGQSKQQHGTSTRSQTETSAEQLERHHAGIRELTAMAVEIEAAKATADPDDLADVLDELITAGRDERIRKIGPVILARLQELDARKVGSAAEALRRASTGYTRWRQAHPTPSQQLRNLEREQQLADQHRKRGYITARQTFRVGWA